MEAYRSGHNGTDSKSVVPHGTVGSNPTASAKQIPPPSGGGICFVELHDEEPRENALAYFSPERAFYVHFPIFAVCARLGSESHQIQSPHHP